MNNINRKQSLKKDYDVTHPDNTAEKSVLQNEGSIDHKTEMAMIANIIRNASSEDITYICDLLPINAVQERISRELSSLYELKKDLGTLSDKYTRRNENDKH